VSSYSFTPSRGRLQHAVSTTRDVWSLLSTKKTLVDDVDNSANPQQPLNFREAEVLGLRLMQEGQHEEALKGKEAWSELYVVGSAL
jgi:hypothetical protein